MSANKIFFSHSEVSMWRIKITLFIFSFGVKCQGWRLMNRKFLEYKLNTLNWISTAPQLYQSLIKHPMEKESRKILSVLILE